MVDRNHPLLSEGEPITFSRGTVLWWAGDPADSLIAICTGVIKLERTCGERSMILELVGRGGLVGEEAAVAGTARATTSAVVSGGHGFRVSRRRLLRQLSRRPSLARPLMEVSQARAAIFADRLADLHSGRVAQRLARLLQQLGRDHGLRDARGTFVPLPLSRRELSDLIGCRDETVTRIMTRWQRAGMVETLREGLVLRSEGWLAREAGQASSAA